ncbi:MAG: TetR/AcrR family transcriptional regulator [Candidatus Binataceae bacterium]
MAGRPSRTAAAKAPQILDVALDVFTLHGYQTASMDMIAAQASMSKQTLYRYFGSKEQLFVHVVQALIERSPVRMPALVGGGGRALRSLLIAFANQLATAFCDPKTVQAFRLVISEGARRSNLGQLFYAEITKVAAHPLAARLAVAADRNLLSVAEPFEAAVRLIATIKEYFLWPRLLGRPGDFGHSRQKQIVRELVDEFLRAHAPRNQAKTVRRHNK